MKQLLAIGCLVAATGFAGASDVASQAVHGISVKCFSENGEWMVCETDMEKSLVVFNLVTGQKWEYIWNGQDLGTTYDMPLTTGVSNDGTVVGEVNNVPSYWRNGKWTPLSGPKGSGAAVVGAITPDGSVIVGGFSDVSFSFEDHQMTYPCYWERQPNGTFGEPVFLPNPGRDIFGLSPQYLHATSISADGKTIGATMRSGQGFHHFPFSYTRNEDGTWNCLPLGVELIVPPGVEIPKYPGEYHGPMNPNYEEYMTSDELNAFYAAGYKFIDDLYAQGITDETEITILELQFALEFMSEEERAEYEPLLRAFLDAYVPWYEAYEAYMAFIESIDSTGVYFQFNNVYVSPDGKYVYATGSGTGSRNNTFAPVRFDARTGEATTYSLSRDTRISCITADYSVLCVDNNSNSGIAYIYPAGSTDPVSLNDFVQANCTPAVYDWMRANLYVNFVTGLTSAGDPIISEGWSQGKPVATPDMTLLGFGVDTELWYPAPDKNSFVSTFVINTGLNQSGVEGVAADTGAEISLTGGGEIRTTGDIVSIAVYDMAGLKVFETLNPSTTVATGLPSGLYIVRALRASGEALTLKAAF